MAKLFGPYFVIYTALGIVTGLFSKNISKDNKLSIVYMTALFTVITEIIIYLSFVVIYKYDFELLAMLDIIVKETIYNIIIARFLFSPLTVLAEIINKCKNSYYLL